MKTKIYRLCSMALLCTALQAQGQTITTFAGNQPMGAGFSGDGGFAASAQMNHAKSVTMDGTGNVYISDAYNNRIRKVNTGSIISTITGNTSAGYGGDGGPATAAYYDHPNYVRLDGNGNIYISDPNNQRIRMVDAAGNVNTVVGNGNPGYSGDGGPATAAEINYPATIALDAAGNLYIADQMNNVIRKVDASGTITTIAGTGNTGYTGEGGPATAADIGFPYGLAFDNAGNLHVSLYYEARVLKIDATSGNITTVAGSTFGYSGDGGPATAAEMSGPWGITFDYLNNLYICDFENERVRMVNSTSGVITTIAGTGSIGFSGDGGPATAAKLSGPTDVWVGPDLSVYIAEYNNHIVRKIAGTATNLPVFASGAAQTMTLCVNAPATPVNTHLAVGDADAGQPLTWSVWQAPLHGTLVAAYTATATGSTITPTGLAYTPTTGYNGTDSFKVRVFDGTGYDTTTVVVTINPCGNAAPIFTGGATQSLVLCKDDPATPINTQLAVSDADMGQTLTWSPIAVPSHGTLVVTYSAPSTGGTVTPTGLSYTPTSGYTGADMYKVRVTDGTDSDTTTINVTINPCVVSVGAVNGSETILSVFPNPTTGSFTFGLQSAINEEVHISIVNVVGEQVKQLTTTTNNKTNITLNAPAGIYMLTATTEHGMWSTRIAVRP